MPEIAGLRWLLPLLLSLPDAALSGALVARAKRMLGEMPLVPQEEGHDGLRLAAAAEV